MALCNMCGQDHHLWVDDHGPICGACKTFIEAHDKSIPRVIQYLSDIVTQYVELVERRKAEDTEARKTYEFAKTVAQDAIAYLRS